MAGETSDTGSGTASVSEAETEEGITREEGRIEEDDGEFGKERKEETKLFFF